MQSLGNSTIKHARGKTDKKQANGIECFVLPSSKTQSAMKPRSLLVTGCHETHSRLSLHLCYSAYSCHHRRRSHRSVTFAFLCLRACIDQYLAIPRGALPCGAAAPPRRTCWILILHLWDGSPCAVLCMEDPPVPICFQLPPCRR